PSILSVGGAGCACALPACVRGGLRRSLLARARVGIVPLLRAAGFQHRKELVSACQQLLLGITLQVLGGHVLALGHAGHQGAALGLGARLLRSCQVLSQLLICLRQICHLRGQIIVIGILGLLTIQALLDDSVQLFLRRNGLESLFVIVGIAVLIALVATRARCLLLVLRGLLAPGGAAAVPVIRVGGEHQLLAQQVISSAVHGYFLQRLWLLWASGPCFTVHVTVFQTGGL